MTQTLGLFCGGPFIFAVGWTRQVPRLILAMTCFGLFKGIYDSNIWASLHDVVPPERRATAVGVINSIGWLGAGTATVTIAAASQRFGMSACISATSLIYLFSRVSWPGGLHASCRAEPRRRRPAVRPSRQRNEPMQTRNGTTPGAPLHPAVFLDRDGTLIEDRGHLADPADIVFYPNTVEALRRLQERFVLFIVTHQPWVARGILTMEDVERVNARIVCAPRRARRGHHGRLRVSP